MASTSTSLLPSPVLSGSMTTSSASSSTASRTRPPIPAFQHQQPPASSSFKGPSASLPSSSASSSIHPRPKSALRASRITYASSDRMSSVAHTPDPSAKLKRLSLVSRPVSLDLDRDSAKGATRAEGHVGRGAGSGEEEQENVPPLSAFSPIATPSTPRTARRGAGLRSSISYSPAPRHLTFGIEGPDGKADKHERPTRSLTLTDKHADLLRLIAQKERKVHEVKQELEAHERALAQLKAKWAAVVSRSAPTPAAAPYISNSMAFPTSTPTPTSASSSSSSLSSSAPPLASTTPSAPSAPAAPDPAAESYMALLQAQTEGLISPATLQGGKRFWGQLVKTVSAAAAGTVPDDPPLDLYALLCGVERRRADDRSGLKSMLPAWASPPPPPPERSAPLPPSNRRRLPSDRSHSSKGSPSLQESLVLVDGGDETADSKENQAEVDLLGDDVLDMVSTSATSLTKSAAVQPEKDDEGWGW